MIRTDYEFQQLHHTIELLDPFPHVGFGLISNTSSAEAQIQMLEHLTPQAAQQSSNHSANAQAGLLSSTSVL